LTRKVGQTDLVFGVRWDGGSLVGICMQDYKSLCAEATIYSTLVNIKTDRQTYRHTQTYTQTAF